MTPFPAGSTGPSELDPEPPSSRRRERPGVVGAALADQPRAAAERRRPGRDVRRLAAGPQHDRATWRRRRGERLLEAHDDVEHEVAEGDDRIAYDPRMALAAARIGVVARATTARGDSAAAVRSLLLGGLLGASAAAAARRLRPPRRRRERRPGSARSRARRATASCPSAGAADGP